MRAYLLIGMVCIGLLASKAHAVTASSWLVADGTGQLLQSKNIDQVRSIASITKLVTAMVVLRANQPLDEYVGNRTRRELIQLAMVHSDNQASETLCKAYPGGRDACVREMNRFVRSLGLHETHFVDPTGLGVMNISTARELIILVQTAERYPEIVEASRMSSVKIKIRNRWIVFPNTNPIIGK